MKKSIKILFYIIVAIYYSSLYVSVANAGTYEFIKNIGGSGSDALNSVIRVSDGYIAVGSSSSTNAGFTSLGGSDGIIVKFDLNGNQQWIKNVGKSASDTLNSVVAVSGGYVAVGKSYNPNPTDIYYSDIACGMMAKFDTNGNQVWVKYTYYMRDNVNLTSVVAVSGGFVAVGNYPNSSNVPLGVIIKFDTNGNQLWLGSAGGWNVDYLNSVIEVSDGYIAVGGFASNDAGFTSKGSFDGVIVKFDLSGNRSWIKNIGGAGSDYLNSVVAVSDGYIAVGEFGSNDAGFTSKGNNDGVIVKFDINGNLIWIKNAGGSDNDYFKSVAVVSDGYIVTGHFRSVDAGFVSKGNWDGIIAKFDTSGNQLWIKNFGGSSYEYVYSVTASDTGYAAVGTSYSTNGGFTSKGNTDGIIYTLIEDNTPPAQTTGYTSGARYINGNNYWVKKDDIISFWVQGVDTGVGMQRNYFLARDNVLNPYRAHYSNGAIGDTNSQAKMQFQTSTIDTNTSTTLRVTYPIKILTTEDITAQVEAITEDNVGNRTGGTWIDSGMRIKVDNTAPSTPTLTFGGVTQNSITLNWAAFSDAGSGYKLTRIHAQKWNGSTWVNEVDIDGIAGYEYSKDYINSSMVTHTINGLQAGSQYRFYVRYLDNVDNQGNSGWIEKWTLPSVPAIPTGTYGGLTWSQTEGRGYVIVNWTPVTGATGYKLAVWDGGVYRYFDVGNVTSWDSRIARIYPSEATINSYADNSRTIDIFNRSGTGLDLRDDPSKLYLKSTITTYNNTHNYFFRIVAYNSSGDSAYSGAYMPTLPNRTDSESPTITFGINGNTTPAKNHSTTVMVTDVGSGVAGIEYVWSTGTTTPSSGWVSTTNGSTLEINGVTGERYLHIRAVDNVGNTVNLCSNAFTVDNTPPTISIGAPSASTTRTGPITYTVTYSGASAVTLANANVTLTTTGTATGTVAVSGTGTTTRTVTISSITGDGTIGISIAAGTASDAAGNVAIAAGPSTTFTVDNMVPSVVITATPSTNPTNATNIIYTFTFSEVVIGFDIGDVNVTNGTKVNMTHPDTLTYMLSVNRVADGTQTVSVAAGVCTDVIGNNNTAASRTVTIDTVAPTLTITSNPSTSQTNATSIIYTFKFSEAVTGFTASDITVTNGTKGTLQTTNSDTYTMTITKVADGDQVVTVAAAVCTDLAGNGNLAASRTITIDTTGPTATITASTSDITKENSITYTIKFSESVIGFTVGDITVTNGEKGTFTTVSADTYTLVVTNTGTTTQTITIPAGVCKDNVGNDNLVITKTISIDTIPPTIIVTPTKRESSTLAISATVSVSDDIGVSAWQYQWTESSIKPSEGWKIGTGQASRTMPDPGIGVWYLHAEALDMAGNYKYVYYGPYIKIPAAVDIPNDITPPTITADIENRAGGTTDIKVNLTVTDNIKVREWKYIWSTLQVKPAAGWITETTETTETTKEITQGQLGTWYLYVYAEDLNGNKTEKRFGPYKKEARDMYGPTITVDKTTRALSTSDIPVRMTITDASGVGNYKYQWTTSTLKPSTGWTETTVTGTQTTVTRDTTRTVDGIWYLHIEATDSSTQANKNYKYYGPYARGTAATTNNGFAPGTGPDDRKYFKYYIGLDDEDQMRTLLVAPKNSLGTGVEKGGFTKGKIINPVTNRFIIGIYYIDNKGIIQVYNGR